MMMYLYEYISTISRYINARYTVHVALWPTNGKLHGAGTLVPLIVMIG